MTKKNLVRVTILGEEYTLRSGASPEHTRAVAQYVDQAIRGVMNSGTVVETHKAAILAALEITDELFRARDTGSQLRAHMRALSGEVRRWLPPAKRGEPTPVPGSTPVQTAEPMADDAAGVEGIAVAPETTGTD